MTILKRTSKGEKAASDEVDAHPTISTLEQNRLPTIFVSMIEGHAYKCDECTPKFATELETKLIRNIHRNNTAKLQDQTRTRLTYDFVNKHSDRIENEAIQRLIDSAKEKQQARLNAYEAELKAKISKLWHDQLTDEYKTQVRYEVKENLFKQVP